MATILNFVTDNREDAREAAIENAWNDFQRLTREMVEAQKRMHEAHGRYLALKYGEKHDR